MLQERMQEIAVLFKDLKFKKKIFGGIDEADVWRKLDMIQKEYRKVYEAQELSYRAILKANGIDPGEFDGPESTGKDQ